MEEISFQERKNHTYKEFKKTKDEIIKKEFKLREILYRYFQENEGKHYEDIIKMYSELEEPQEKPVIKFKELYVDMNPKYGYEIQFVSLKNNEVKTYKYSLTLEEKDGMLITDDFIFIKD